MLKRERACGPACFCAHLNRYVLALTHFFQKMIIKIIFIKRENWSRIRDQRYFDSPFLSYWRVTNFEMRVTACPIQLSLIIAMDFIPCQPSSLSFFKPCPAASCTAGMCWWASGSFGLQTGQPEALSTSQHCPQSRRGWRQVRFSNASQISMVSTGMKTRSCPYGP